MLGWVEMGWVERADAPDFDDPPGAGAVYISPPVLLIPVALLLLTLVVVVVMLGAPIPTTLPGCTTVTEPSCPCPPDKGNGQADCVLLLDMGMGMDDAV